MTRYEFNKVHWLPVIMTLLILLSVSLPYFTSVGLGHLDPFIPYISHAAAFPPQSAFISIFMTLSAPFALFTFALRYIVISHRKNRRGQRRIKILNIVSLMFALLAIIFMIYASHNPLGFVQNDHEWIRLVVIPHLVGAAMLFFCFTGYVLTQAYLTFLLKTVNSANVFVHAALGMVVVLSCWTTCIPIYAAIRDMKPKIVNKETGAINLEMTEYGFYYIISSLSEWGFTLFSLLFIATFYKDFQNTSVRWELKPKVPDLIFVESRPRRILNKQEVTKM